MKTKAWRISDWNVQGTLPHVNVAGTSWDRPNMKDGGPIYTSALKVLDLHKNEIHTLNSTYTLEVTLHKECLLARVGGDLCCFITPVIHCSTCLLVGCRVCFTDYDTLFVKTCSSESKLHTWEIVGVK